MTETRTLPCRADSVPAARRFVRDGLILLGASGACDDAEALVSELATNAVLHARTTYTITISRNDRTLRVQVHDASPAVPRQRSYGRVATTGRGLRLLSSIASAWGVDRETDGKTVWFELPVDGSTCSFAPWDTEEDVEALLSAFDDDAGAGSPSPQLRAA